MISGIEYTMKQQVVGIFKTKLNRNPTDQELNDWYAAAYYNGQNLDIVRTGITNGTDPKTYIPLEHRYYNYFSLNGYNSTTVTNPVTPVTPVNPIIPSTPVTSVTIATPSITSVTPTQAMAGMQVTLTGSFSNISSIQFSPSPNSDISSISATQQSTDGTHFSFTVPTSFSTYTGTVTVTVTNTNGKTSNGVSLTIVPIAVSSTPVIPSTTQARTTAITGYYQTYLHRAPDQSGLSYWVASTYSLDQLKQFFQSSPEYYYKQQIISMFQSSLSRQPTDQELADYYAKLALANYNLDVIKRSIQSLAPTPVVPTTPIVSPVTSPKTTPIMTPAAAMQSSAAFDGYNLLLQQSLKQCYDSGVYCRK